MSITVLPTRTDVPRYDFEIDLEGTSYNFDFHWNERDAGWYFQITETATGDVLLSGRRVVIGFPLLGRFRDSRLPPGEITAIDMGGGEQEAGLEDLGDRVKLLYFDRSEIPEVWRA